MRARPLDRLRSIKAKLGVLVIASVLTATVLIIVGLREDVRFRYMIVATTAASLAVTMLLAHGMTAPLREMNTAARAMARGDYSRRVRATSRDEVGRLADSFNLMAGDLEVVDRHRRELLANVSHELRTPIAALRALLENMVDGVQQPDARNLTRALEQTERLGGLVADLLDLSRVDSGAVPLDRREFAVGPFLEAAAGEAGAVHPKVTVRVDAAPPGLTAVADTGRLHQVVANLLANACRHSPPGGTVTVSARPHGASGGLRLEVQDEGPGIPREERRRVFERFSRGGGQAAPRDGGGTGLGLAIARWAVELHGGTITATDPPQEGPHGCRMLVQLPGVTAGGSRSTVFRQ